MGARPGMRRVRVISLQHGCGRMDVLDGEGGRTGSVLARRDGRRWGYYLVDGCTRMYDYVGNGVVTM